MIEAQRESNATLRIWDGPSADAPRPPVSRRSFLRTAVAGIGGMTALAAALVYLAAIPALAGIAAVVAGWMEAEE